MRSAENTSDLSDGDLIVNYKRKSKPAPVSSSESSDDEDFEAEPPNKQSKSVQESTLLSPPSTSVVDDTDLEHPAHFVLVNDDKCQMTSMSRTAFPFQFQITNQISHSQ
jgi:hypothetical protein